MILDFFFFFLIKMNFPKKAHSAIICGATGCGKTEFTLDLLEKDGIHNSHQIGLHTAAVATKASSATLPSESLATTRVQRKR